MSKTAKPTTPRSRAAALEVDHPPPPIPWDAESRGWSMLVSRLFDRACRDCMGRNRKRAISAILFFCSPTAEQWLYTSRLMDAAPEQALAGLAARYWRIVKKRFDLTLDDLEAEMERMEPTHGTIKH